MARRRRNPDLNWLLWGAVAAGIYFIYKSATAAKTAIVNAQSAAGSAVADLFPNNVLIGPQAAGTQFQVTMPDGSKQTVNAGSLPVTNPGAAPYDTSILPSFNAGDY